MWTVLWSDHEDHYERLESSEQVGRLLHRLMEEDIPLEDVLIFPPEADEFVINGTRF